MAPTELKRKLARIEEVELRRLKAFRARRCDARMARGRPGAAARKTARLCALLAATLACAALVVAATAAFAAAAGHDAARPAAAHGRAAVQGAPPVHATPPVTLTGAAADTLRAAILADRRDTETWLRSAATSYLATVSRVDFGDARTLVVGRAAGCAVRLDDPAIAAHQLSVTVDGDSFHVVALDSGATFRVGGRDTTRATLGPSSIGMGRYMLRLSHQRFPALIVFDPKSPRFALYKGLAYFPVDLRYRFVAPLVPNPSPDTTIIMSTRGNARRAVRVGWFDLAIAGRPCRLEVHRLLEPGVDEHDLSVFFRDATTGHETYAVGRYVDPVRQADGRWLVDLNLAYNPACAFSPHYNCPIPSRANTLPVAVRAGEMDAHYPHE